MHESVIWDTMPTILLYIKGGAYQATEWGWYKPELGRTGQPRAPKPGTFPIFRSTEI